MSNKSPSLVKSFGNNVRQERKQQLLSQEDLALKVGLDRTYISGIERGVRNPSLKNVEKIARALKIKKENIF